MSRLALAALAVALALPAAAESPRVGSFELRIGGYRPNIDAEFGGAAAPYGSIFGSGRGLMVQALVTRTLYHGYGSLDAGLGAGYFEKYGRSLLLDPSGNPDPSRPSGDATSLKVVPFTLAVNYRFDWLAEKLSVPFAPYARAAMHWYLWWVNNGAGDTASAGGLEGRGGTFGYSFTLGLALMLDFFDRTLATEMDRDTGINHTYLFADFTKSYISDFHGAHSWDLSNDRWGFAGGLLLVF